MHEKQHRAKTLVSFVCSSTHVLAKMRRCCQVIYWCIDLLKKNALSKLQTSAIDDDNDFKEFNMSTTFILIRPEEIYNNGISRDNKDNSLIPPTVISQKPSKRMLNLEKRRLCESI